MRRNYKIFLTTIFMSTFVVASGLLLFGTYDATQADTLDCERIRSECVPRGPKLVCPNMNLTPRCPMNASIGRRN